MEQGERWDGAGTVVVVAVRESTHSRKLMRSSDRVRFVWATEFKFTQGISFYSTIHGMLDLETEAVLLVQLAYNSPELVLLQLLLSTAIATRRSIRSRWWRRRVVRVQVSSGCPQWSSCYTDTHTHTHQFSKPDLTIIESQKKRSETCNLFLCSSPSCPRAPHPLIN